MRQRMADKPLHALLLQQHDKTVRTCLLHALRETLPPECPLDIAREAALHMTTVVRYLETIKVAPNEDSCFAKERKGRCEGSISSWEWVRKRILCLKILQPH